MAINSVQHRYLCNNFYLNIDLRRDNNDGDKSEFKHKYGFILRIVVVCSMLGFGHEHCRQNVTVFMSA